ncbi:MAG: DNA translocase FtsK [Sediminibacterium sp.]|nr:DNA translocase FtsK [Sediminibacterium sp.]
MANSLKKKTPPPPDPEVLTPDKEAQVTVTEVVKDERTAKIAGAVSLLVTAFLFVSLTSYLFTWQEDQDKVHQFGIKIFATDDVKVTNLLGVLGAYVAHTLIYKGFGIASFLFCTFFFVLGMNLLFGKKIFNLFRNARYVLIGLVVISTTVSFATAGFSFSWGGAVGELSSAWLVKWVGRIGTGAIIFLAAFSCIIWRFNPIFKWPVWTVSRQKKNSNEILPLTEDDEMPVKKEWNKEGEEAMGIAPLADTEPEEPVSLNTMKQDSKGVVVMMPDGADAANPMNDFGVVEKEDELAAAIEIAPEENFSRTANVRTSSKASHPDLELEINELPETEAIPMAAVAGKLTTKYDATLDLKDYKYPTLDLLETHGSEKIVHDPQELETHKNQIIATLKNYDIAIQRIAATVGPTVTLYEIVPAPGVRISRIKNLEDDIALSLAALGIRIIAPIPGKGTIGIEVPNVRKSVVSMRTLLASEKFQNNNFSLPIAIGKKIDNENFIVDLANMPHLLMAGATGQGKSVGLNAILVSLLYKKHPSQLKFVLVDPKKVELSLYRRIEKHFLAKLPGEEESIITDTKKVVHTLNALCIEMDNRYDLLKEAHCRNIKEYNEKFTSRKLNPEKGHQYLPFIVLVVDEFADLIMTAGKEVEMPIARLAQLARAIGIHLIIATQRPSVNIITGTIKANFPARIGFKVSSKIDSRTILDAGGAEQLIGKGDMLVSYNGEITRLQCAFVDTPEVERVCEFIGDQRGYPQAFLLPEYVDEKDLDGRDFDSSDRDPLFEDAARLIVQSQMGSTSLIQRRMKLGYNRAGRLMDQLEAAGVVGPNQGSKTRDVIFKTDMELQAFLDTFV